MTDDREGAADEPEQRDDEPAPSRVPPPSPPTVPNLPAVTTDSMAPPSSSASREAMMPPAPPSNAPPVLTSQPAEVEAPPSSVGDRPSSLVSFPSMVPESLRDTAVTQTNPDIVNETSAVRDRPLLLRMDGTEAGQVHSLTDESIQIGRHPTTQITVNDTGVSRVHARVFRVEGTYQVEDLGSSNGTFVDGARVDQKQLTDGNTLRLGPRVTFRFALLDTEQEDLLRQLYESSKRDALTGVFNRKHFEERLKAEMAFAQRHGSPLGLVLFDLDFFKKVNDTHGHPGGDAVLRHVAAIVTQKLRAEDLFARVGGEEFAILVRGSSLRQVVRVGERLRVAVSTSPAHFEGEQIPVSISVGVATSDCAPMPSEQALVAIADQRLYRAKQGGRDRVVFEDA